MDNVILKDEVIIEDLIYEIRGKQVMLDSEISATKWHDYLIDKIKKGRCYDRRNR